MDKAAVAHSRLYYARENLSFEGGDTEDLSRFADGALEVIEHVSEQEWVLAEVRSSSTTPAPA